MKKSLLISVLTAIILVLLCLCSIMAVILYGVFKEVQVSDIARYGNWNKTTEKILEDFDASLLPEEDLMSAYCRDFYYHYHEYLFSDPNFYIYTDLKLDDRQFVNELERLEGLCVPVELKGEKYFLVSGSPDAISDYCDGEIRDGAYYFFQLALADEKLNRIRYLTAYIWDYHREYLVSSLLSPLLPT